MENAEAEKSNGKPSAAVVQEAGLLFFIEVFLGFSPVYIAIFTFHKERATDMYRLSTSDLPLDLVLPVIFLLVVYFMAGLRLSAGPFFPSILTIFPCSVAAQDLGRLAIGATTLASLTVITLMLAGGFFVKNVPIYNISWIQYQSFNYQTYMLLPKLQYDLA